MHKVLVVDDEMPIRQWLEFCINRIEGYEVAGIAANGAEGFSLYRKMLPDIVITDIRMPVILSTPEPPSSWGPRSTF